jgi:hypothetical protein
VGAWSYVTTEWMIAPLHKNHSTCRDVRSFAARALVAAQRARERDHRVSGLRSARQAAEFALPCVFSRALRGRKCRASTATR